MQAKGRAFKYGDNVDTDVIIPARYLNSSDPAELATHCMEDIDNTFVKREQKGDIIVSFDGQTVSGREDLENKLAYYEAGESVDVIVSRADNGEYVQKTIYVTLGNRSDYTG